MTYALGAASLAKLQGVHPALVEVVRHAITLTTQDFTVQEGVRTLETQKLYMARGVTRTMNSKHLAQPDGYGHAVDLVPVIGGSPRWEWPLIYPVAAAMWAAAKALGQPLRWGGVWDMPFLSTGPDVARFKADVAAYCVRHPGPDFLDGPHYEID